MIKVICDAIYEHLRFMFLIAINIQTDAISLQRIESISPVPRVIIWGDIISTLYVATSVRATGSQEMYVLCTAADE